MLPLYKLVLPITALSLGHYITHQVCYSAVQRQYQANTLQLQYTEHVSIVGSALYISLPNIHGTCFVYGLPLNYDLTSSSSAIIATYMIM